METNQVLIWLVLSAGGIVGGWWLAARPQVRTGGLAVPVAALVLLLSILALLLSATGQDFQQFVLNMRALAS